VADLSRLAGQPAVHPLKWAVPDAYADQPAPRLLKRLTRLAHRRQRLPVSSTARRLTDWLAAAHSTRPDAVRALEALAWSHLLPQLATVVTSDQWQQLWSALHALADEGAGIGLTDEPLTHQLLTGELPLTLAWLFPDLPRSRGLVRAAVRALSRGVAELLDGDGLPHAAHWGAFLSLAACWTRCVLLSQSAGWTCFDAEARVQYDGLALQLVRALRPDGTLSLSRGLSGDWSPDLVRVLMALQPDRVLRTLARRVLPGGSATPVPRRSRKWPAPSVYSEEAGACVMRAHWSRKSPQFTCLFDGDRLCGELGTDGRVLWSGDMTPQVLIDGQRLELQSAWTELCWFTDEDVDYLELEADLSHGWQLQRQMLLARQDHVFVVADAVLGPRAASVRYDARFPLAEDVRFEPLAETREGVLRNSRALCTVLPLALPEWRAGAGAGDLRTDAHHLQLTMEEHTPRFYAPLWFDLAPHRVAERRTWRQLTVAEAMQVRSRDVAVAYRVQVGAAQWLLYRSLAARRSRSVLGQNLSAEFVAARFEQDGTLDQWIEIES
jgi:hypothetical protein